MRNVPFIDATGVYRLKEVIRQYEENGTQVFIIEPRKTVLRELLKNQILSKSRIKTSLNKAIEAINDLK